MAMDFKPTDMQKAAIDHRGSAMLISAGAGSGKTKVLIERIMSLVEEGADIDRFLIITFTRAAAAELRERLASAISQRLSLNPSDKRLRRQSSLIYRARISTIHAFCSEIIRESAYSVDVRPDFRQLEESEAAALLDETLEELLENSYDHTTPAFEALVDMFGHGRDDSSLKRIIRETYTAVQSHPSPEGWMRKQTEPPAKYSDAGQTPWGELLLRKAGRTVKYWYDCMNYLREEILQDAAVSKAYLASWDETLLSLRSYLSAIESGWESARLFGTVSFPRLGALRGRKDDEFVNNIQTLRKACKKSVDELAQGFISESAGLLEDMAAIKPITDELFRLVAELGPAFSEAKKKRAALDFNDLEHLAHKILINPETGLPTERAGEISERFCEILVDEYQDVNRIQEDIFRAVSRSGKNITMVGDVKQSIYRFRLADPSIFLEKYLSYADHPAAEGEPVRIRLSHNFRSHPEILDTVNSVFSRLMSPSLGEMEYGPGERMEAGGNNENEAAFSEPVEFCICELEEGADRIEYEARCAAGYIERLLKEGVMIEGRPLRADDIAILLRSVKGAGEQYSSALEARGIPYTVAGGSVGLFDCFENSYLLSILKIIDNPIQDIPLIAALRGPIWRFTADELAHIRAASRSGDFYSALKKRAEEDEKCASFLADLDYYRQLASELPTDALIRTLLNKTGLPALAEARRRGASERLYAVQNYACSCESAGCGGLYGFLNRLENSDPPKLTAISGSGVTIMSIHGSKGLEFPVVLLCDLARRFNLDDLKRPLLIHRELGAGPKYTDLKRGIVYPTLSRLAVAEKIRNETLSENMRVLYVAMTRPKKKLVCITTVPDIDKKLAACRVGLTDPPSPEILEKCLSFSDWLLTVLSCSPDFHYTRLEPPEAPGAAAEAEAPEEVSEVNGETLERLRTSLSWKAPGASLGLPSKVTATALKKGLIAAEAAEGAEEIAPAEDEKLDYFRRPAFVSAESGLSPSERGTALHMAMQLIDFSKTYSYEAVAAEVERMKKMKLLTEAQADSISINKLRGFFDSELGRRALDSVSLKREFKFSVLVPAVRIYGRGEGEVLLQGVIDLFFEEIDGIVLVDFKSDRVSAATREARAESYKGQLEIYSIALEMITGKPVKEKHLFFFECDGKNRRLK